MVRPLGRGPTGALLCLALLLALEVKDSDAQQTGKNVSVPVFQVFSGAQLAEQVLEYGYVTKRDTYLQLVSNITMDINWTVPITLSPGLPFSAGFLNIKGNKSQLTILDTNYRRELVRPG